MASETTAEESKKKFELTEEQKKSIADWLVYLGKALINAIIAKITGKAI